MLSMAYKVIRLQSLGGSPKLPFVPQGINNATFLFRNDAVNLTLARDFGWAIANLTIHNKSYVQPGAPANRIGLWEDSGNIYQFGMEFIDGCTTGTFSPHSSLNSTGTAQLVENGPIRWRFNATLKDTFGNLYATQYDLVRSESLVRINTTGAAPQSGGWSVMASFPMQTADGARGMVLEYGTVSFREPQKSWAGPTFRANHDFSQLVARQNGAAVAAVYHNGMPAWSTNGTTLHGVLLRNTPGAARSANGTDNGTHSQHYTFPAREHWVSAAHGALRTHAVARRATRPKPARVADACGGATCEHWAAGRNSRRWQGHGWQTGAAHSTVEYSGPGCRDHPAVALQ
jgi:hypothetical protein